MKHLIYLTVTFLSVLSPRLLHSAPLVYEGGDGPGKGKHIVFIANDHEYRSEETCPALAKILARHHGFRCTVLFGIDANGHIAAGDNPVPGLEVLKDADLLVFFTRFMKLPDSQVDQLVDYFERGGPVVGLRTSTHAFSKQAGKWEKLNYNYAGEDYRGGLGEQIFGNTWHRDRGQSHYGENHVMGSRITPIAAAENHPILTGVGPIHAFSGAYLSRPPADSTPLVEVQVLNTFEASDDINQKKPKVSAGWTRDFYIAPSGQKKQTRVVYTSFGASEDLLDEDARRLLVNACMWAGGWEKEIAADLDVSIVGGYQPSPYSSGAFFRVGVNPADLAGWDGVVMPEDSKMGNLDAPTKSMSRRINQVLRSRPWVVERLKKSHPGFDRSRLQPAGEKQ